MLEKKHKGGKISHLDGLRVDFKDWWFNARPSNTEDLLRVVVETKTKFLMKEKLKEIMKILKGKNHLKSILNSKPRFLKPNFS